MKKQLQKPFKNDIISKISKEFINKYDSYFCSFIIMKCQNQIRPIRNNIFWVIWDYFYIEKLRLNKLAKKKEGKNNE